MILDDSDVTTITRRSINVYGYFKTFFVYHTGLIYIRYISLDGFPMNFHCLRSFFFLRENC